MLVSWSVHHNRTCQALRGELEEAGRHPADLEDLEHTKGQHQAGHQAEHNLSDLSLDSWIPLTAMTDFLLLPLERPRKAMPCCAMRWHGVLGSNEPV